MDISKQDVLHERLAKSLKHQLLHTMSNTKQKKLLNEQDFTLTL